MFGRAFHVAPVMEPGVTTWSVYLPQSAGGWYDFWTGDHREGGRRHDVPAPLDRLPLHVRAGTILPLGPVLQSTAEATGKELDLIVFPGVDGNYTLYEDGGLNYDYEKGRYSLIEMSWDDSKGELTIGARKGRFETMPDSRRFNIRVAQNGVTPFNGPVVKTFTYNGGALRYRPSL
jgi:alpha-D-xyloside xylohydrolase